MGTKNVNGKGTLYHDQTRELWVYQISYLDPEDGKNKRKKFAHKSKSIAVAKGDSFLKDLSSGMLPSAITLTVGEWVRQWLNDYCKPKVRPRTFEKYCSGFQRYILPRFDTTLLKTLKAIDIQRHFNKLAIDGRVDGQALSSSTIRGIRKYFSMCIDSAIRNGLTNKNPVKDTVPPKLVKRDFTIPTPDEIKKLLDATNKIEDEFMRRQVFAVTRLTANTGLRIGEVFGLRFSDIDFDNKVLNVNRSLSYIASQGYSFQMTKTECSKRRILLDDSDVQMLMEHQKWLQEYAQKVMSYFTDNKIVFSRENGFPQSINRFRRGYFVPLIERAGIEGVFTFHCLRHYHATILLKSGVNPKVIQERLGHSDISMTLNVYSHVLPDMQAEAVAAIKGLIKS